MIGSFLKYIRSKSRAEWREVYRRLVLLVRDWLSRNGEVSALVGLVSGIAVVLFFKLILVISVLVSLVVFLLYQYAEE